MRWPHPDNPYAGRKKPQVRWPKASVGAQSAPGHFESGGRISSGRSTKHPAGLGDNKEGGWLRGTSGESHPQYHRTNRNKRNAADYRGGRGK